MRFLGISCPVLDLDKATHMLVETSPCAASFEMKYPRV